MSNNDDKEFIGCKVNGTYNSNYCHLNNENTSRSLKNFSQKPRNDVFLTENAWNNRKQVIINFISLYIRNNKLDLLNSFSASNIEDFFISIIRKIFISLQNDHLLAKINPSQFLEISPLIFNQVRDFFSSQGYCVTLSDLFLERIHYIYGFIFLAVNMISGKVYVGQTIRTIEKEWGEIFADGKALRKKRQADPTKNMYERYIHNAIAKYPDDVWNLQLIDIAYNKTELDDKEQFYIKIFDSMNPKCGYNMTTGGTTGGKLSPVVKEKVRNSVKNVWEMPGYRERLGKAQGKAWKNEKCKEKARVAQKKAWENEERKEKAKKAQTELWNDEMKREQMIVGIKEAATERWKSPSKKMLDNLEKMHQITRKIISNVREFLNDIKSSQIQEAILKKYNMKSHMTLNTRIREILGNFGITNYIDARTFLKDRTVDEILKYLDNPQGYSLFRDPAIIEFLQDVKNSKLGTDLYQKYQISHKNYLIDKIQRIVGKFGINNYTDLKDFLKDRTVDECLRFFEDLEK